MPKQYIDRVHAMPQSQMHEAVPGFTPKKSFAVGGRICTDYIIGAQLPNMQQFHLPRECWLEIQSWVEGNMMHYTPSIMCYRVVDQHNALVALEWVIGSMKTTTDNHTVFYEIVQKTYKGVRRGTYPIRHATRYWTSTICKLHFH